MPTMTATVSPAATAMRRDAISRNAGSYEIPVKPKAILDQRKLVCCVSCALGCAMEMINPTWPSLAPLFHYRVSRFEVIGGSDSKGFLDLDKALMTLSINGICTHELHPHEYNDDGLSKPPTDAARRDARNRALAYDMIYVQPRYQVIGGPSRVLSIQEHLRMNHPVVIGIQLPMTYPEGFLDPATHSWLDRDASRVSGVGHCVLLTGYDDSKGSFKGAFHVQDSHGKPSYFPEGRWWLGYDIVDSPAWFVGGYSLIP